MDLVRAVFAVENYDLAATLASGQAFRWRGGKGGWTGVVDGRWVQLRAVAGRIEAETAAPAGDWQWLRHYLQLEVNLPEVLAAFPRGDPALQAAVRACAGLRLLRQEPWECLASFICSSSKQIAQIQQIISRLSRRFGEPLPVPAGEEPAYSFPGYARLAAVSESDLRECKLGVSRALPSRHGAKAGGGRSGFGPALRAFPGRGAGGTAEVSRRGRENRGLCFAVRLWISRGFSRGCMDHEGATPPLFPAPERFAGAAAAVYPRPFRPAGRLRAAVFVSLHAGHWGKMEGMQATLEVLFTPAEFDALKNRDLSNTVCVVFDVLRATTSMLAALHHGARQIIPVKEISEALAAQRGLAQAALLAGERNGLRIRAAQTGGVDFDLGNSPREFTRERVRAGPSS